MTQEEMVGQYKIVTQQMNDHAALEKTDRGASGMSYVSVEMSGMIAQRSKLAVAIADSLSGTSFKGWPKS